MNHKFEMTIIYAFVTIMTHVLFIMWRRLSRCLGCSLIVGSVSMIIGVINIAGDALMIAISNLLLMAISFSFVIYFNHQVYSYSFVLLAPSFFVPLELSSQVEYS